jgi:predicted aspartyl protease
LASGVVLSAAARATECAPQLQLSVDAEIDKGGEIYIPLTVNGQTVQVLFCTGCAWSSLGERFVDKAGIAKMKGRFRFVDPAGEEPTYYVRAASVKLGDISFTGKAEFLVDNDSDGGTFGLNLMSNFDVEIDNESHRVLFYRYVDCEAPTLAWTKGAVEIPFHTKDGGPKGVVEIGGKKVAALFSTGFSRTMLALSIARAQLGPQIAANMRPSGSATFYGTKSYPLYDYTLPELTISGLRFTNVPVRLIDLDGFGIDIGMHELSQLHLYFAFKKKRLYLAPR